MESRTDSELLEAARRGDAGSLEALLERHQAQVYRFGMKMCRIRRTPATSCRTRCSRWREVSATSGAPPRSRRGSTRSPGASASRKGAAASSLRAEAFPPDRCRERNGGLGAIPAGARTRSSRRRKLHAALDQAIRPSSRCTGKSCCCGTSRVSRPRMSPRFSASACRRSRAVCTAPACPCARTSRRSSGSRRRSRPAPRRRAARTCSRCTPGSSRTRSGRRSASRWNATSPAAAAAAPPATPEAHACPLPHEPFGPGAEGHPGLGPRRGPELPRGIVLNPFRGAGLSPAWRAEA